MASPSSLSLASDGKQNPLQTTQPTCDQPEHNDGHLETLEKHPNDAMNSSHSTSSNRSFGNNLKYKSQVDENVLYDDNLPGFYCALEEGALHDLEDLVLLSNSIDVNIVFTDNMKFVKRKHRGWKPLHIAAGCGSVKVVRFLLHQGADVDIVSYEGETALHVACKYGAAEVVETLLEFNVFLRDRQNHQGVTPLLKAIFNIQPAFKGNYRRCVDLLLGAGCNSNIASSSMVTPLHMAVDKGDHELVKKLIQAGSNVSAICNKGSSPLLIAVMSKFVNFDIVTNLLLNGADTTIAMNSRSALHIAVSRGDDRIIETFLQVGADVNVQDSSGRTPLYVAVEENNAKVVPILAAGGANLNYVREPQCFSILSQAVKNNSLTMVKLLLTLGATADTETIMWATPLHLAVDQQNLEIVIELLRANCPLNTSSNAKCSLRPLTPVQLALETGNTEIINLLVRAGARVQWPWLQEDRMVTAMNVSSRRDVVVDLMKTLTQIPSLLHLSRVCIRGCLGSKFKIGLKNWENQVLPRKMVDYLAMHDILDNYS